MSLAVEFRSGLMTSDNTTSYTFAGPMPAVANSLLVAFVVATATAAAGTMSGGGLTWVLQDSQAYIGHKAYIFTALVGAIPPADFNPVFDCTGDSATGCMGSVYEWIGVDLVNPVRQTAKNFNGGSATDVGTITFASSLLTMNGYMAAIGKTSLNIAVPPANWGNPLASPLQPFDHEVIVMPAQNETSSGRINGETGTTVTFTFEAGNWGMIGIEINRGPNLLASLGAGG